MGLIELRVLIVLRGDNGAKGANGAICSKGMTGAKDAKGG